MNLLIVLAVCICGTSASALVGAHDNGKNELTVTLFYESYCPDCIQWIGDYLLKAWDKFSSNISLDLVPFGNAQQWYVRDHYKFCCQHGVKECLANKLHACAILQACGQGGTINCGSAEAVGHVIKYIHCVESQEDQLEATPQCAAAEKLQAEDIIKCANNTVGDELLSFYGNRTTDFKPKIGYVPTVAINGKQDKAAEADLVAEICKLKPDWCKNFNLETNRVYG